MIFIIWGFAFLIFMYMAIKFGFFLLSPVVFIIRLLWDMVVSFVHFIVDAYLSMFRKNKIVGIIVTIIIVIVVYNIFFRY
jgi:hypothetical protein